MEETSGIERTLDHAIRYFYGFMVLVNGQMIVRSLGTSTIDIAVTVFAAINFFLYISVLIHNLKGRYVEVRKLLTVLVMTTLCLLATKIIRECAMYDTLYVVISSIVSHTLCLWIISMRIAIISRLQHIAENLHIE